MIVERQQEIFLGLRVFMIDRMKKFLDILALGLAVVGAARFNDRYLQISACLGDLRFKAHAERSDKGRFRVCQIHLGIERSDASTVDHVHQERLDGIIGVMGECHFAASQFPGALDDGTFFER